ncbi:hypothetical protein BDQ12DRAFT_685121 [Crucibulum laeve]|uniref:U3 small nucleolar RNA-associated protein 10 n=1 Tax=Crucibulum laeve TaxID=68775 RepID=A0A5C3LYE3_9AGAR|nr:hypothetical protein BDQ12DRAFT_685121 [Crucibulum laeve]
MSSLAAQLAKSASLNSALLVDRTKRKAGESYLFTGREAGQHDLESVHALGVNGLLQLAALDSSLRLFEDSLFSEQAKSTDRTLLSGEANEELDKAVEGLLALLGPYLMDAPTGKVLEWLVRRFRINEFNIEAVLSLFLPYHESPHFSKMISILHIKPNSTWSFLLPYKSAGQSLPRVSLVTEMLRNSDIARFVTSLLPNAIKDDHCHRVLLAFSAASLHDFIKRSKKLDEGTLAFLLPALLEPLQQKSLTPSKDAILGSYILLTVLSQQCEFAKPALKSILAAMAGCAHHVTTKQFVSAAVIVCQPQVELEKLSDNTVKAILCLSNVEDELLLATSWVGCEKLINPLVTALGHRLADDTTTSLLEALLVTSNVPAAIIEHATKSLLKQVLSSDTLASVVLTARRLLSIIHQRYPAILNDVAERESKADASVQASVEQLLISLSVTPGKSKPAASQKDVDLILASSSADAKVRAIAVKDLIALNGKENSKETSDFAAIRSALVARALDSSIEVLEALYEQPSAITSILLEDDKTYINHLAQTLSSAGAKPKRAVVRIHLAYLASHFCPAASAMIIDDVVHKILFPFLLFSKPRQHTAEQVWEIIESTPAPFASHEWLAGCAGVVKAEREKVMDVVDKMSALNGVLSTRIAQNIIISNDYKTHFSTLVSKLKSTNPHSRALGYLIARSLLSQLSGEHQINTAHQVLKAMDLDSISGIEDASLEKDGLLDAVDDESSSSSIVLKPNSQTTLHRLQISIVASIANIPRPSDFPLDWLSDLNTPSSDDRLCHYIGLMRAVYSLANESSLPVLSTGLLQALFISLKDDALAFLAGIWSGSSTDEKYNDVRHIALLHAAAFLEAHVLENDGMDFQTILPSLLIALQSEDSRIRQVAMECVSRLRILTERKLSNVYRFDIIYGQNERKLQYLDQEDLKEYLGGLVEYRDHFAHDVTYLKIFHEQHLAILKSDKRKNSEYKRRVLCFLLSHINALSVQKAQIALLKSIQTISDGAKAQILQPTVQSLVLAASSVQPKDVFHSFSEDFTSSIIACFDASVAKELNNSQTQWESYVIMIRTYFTAGTAQGPRVLLIRSLEAGLFSKFNQERKIGLSELFLEIGARDAEAYAICKRLLSNVLEDVWLMVHLLNVLSPSSTSAAPRAKRAKTLDAPVDSLPRLTLLVEILGTKSLPGSLELISHLLETLNKVIQSVSSSQADVSYIEQLLMSAIENAATNIMEAPNLSPSTIRLDILVELIRVADNPQTFHQALLLIANLARLAPESVLHNVMPVFTFMGSNVFHRDDTYSFRVVQQTIDGIVPVMVHSLKQAHPQLIDLYIGSREFIRVFTDAANHIPRHRRNNFFAHLVDVLGVKDFLPPVCMLLVEKVASRVIRQTADDIPSSLALPTALLHHQSPATQISALVEILSEAQRLASRVTNPETKQTTFLDGTNDTEHATSPSLLTKRRAQALVIFVGYALKSSTLETTDVSEERTTINPLVSHLIALAVLPEGTNSDGKVGDIVQAARFAVSRALGVMSAVDFVDAVLSMLETDDKNVQLGALELLGDRLPRVSEKVRQQTSPRVNKIISSIQRIIPVSREGPLVQTAFRALTAIVSTICTGEESVVTGMIPSVMSAIKIESLAPAALGALQPMSTKLGPRIIPFFREIISQMVVIASSRNNLLLDDTLAVLHGLLSSIPNFWGSGEVKQVVNLYINHYVLSADSPSSSMSALMKAVTKRIPSKVLLHALVELWSSTKTSHIESLVAYFEVLTRALRNAARPVVLEHLRILFRVFVDALDIIKVSATAGESEVISAFKEMVVKLNESAFRPLFRRLYDWAFAKDDTDSAAKITFCHLYTSLFDFFKGLMNPYMSILILPFVDVLKKFSNSAIDDLQLWSSVIETITRSLTFDDGVFWRDDRLRQISTPILEQVEVCVRLNYIDGKSCLQECLSSLVDTITDDMLLKMVNLNLLMHTRSEDARLRFYALTCSEALWRTHGGKLLGFVAETATFIAECSEDENDMVVRESFRLKDAVESVAGKIDGL